MRLEGKRAAVIGAGSVGDGIGNGRAIAMLFAREGARVLAADRNAEAVTDTVTRITAEGGVADAVEMDATDPAAVEALMSRADALWGGLDILVHVVGMSLPGGVTDTAPEDWDRVFDVNLRSAFLAARTAVPGMAERGGGSLVFRLFSRRRVVGIILLCSLRSLKGGTEPPRPVAGPRPRF